MCREGAWVELAVEGSFVAGISGAFLKEKYVITTFPWGCGFFMHIYECVKIRKYGNTIDIVGNRMYSKLVGIKRKEAYI